MIYKLYLSAFCILFIVGYFFGKDDIRKTSNTVDIIFCLAVALIASTFFSLYPLGNDYPLTDSSVFIYTGKKMLQGNIPYKDFFDHKGILLYFIQCLGLLISPGNFNGIWIIEVLNLSITTWFLFKISGLFSKDKIVRYLAVIATIIICGLRCYEGGNLTEEYALPWISYAIYIFLKYFKNFKYRFRDIIGIGVGFAIVSLLRVNMVAIWAAVMPIIFIRMLYRKQFKELGNCAIGFMIGLLVVYLPVFAYLFHTECLNDMIRYYITFNFQYSGSFDWKNVAQAIVEFMKHMWPVMIAIVISLVFEYKNRLILISLWMLAISLVLAYMNGIMLKHYGIVTLPIFVIWFICAITQLYKLVDLKVKIQFKISDINEGIFIIGLVLSVVMAFVLKSEMTKEILGVPEQDVFSEEVSVYLAENTTGEDDVLIIGNDVKYYLISERETENKFFYQTPPINISYELYEEFISELKRCESDFIIVTGNKEDCLSKGNNLGHVCQYLELLSEEKSYKCQEYGDFYAYVKSPKDF